MTMEEENESFYISFPNLTCYQKALILGALVRQSLIGIGYSPDYHIYELEYAELERERNRTLGDFLLGMKKFYDDLPLPERMVFLCECLEKGRHYRFWWMQYFTRQKYISTIKDVLAKTSLVF